MVPSHTKPLRGAILWRTPMAFGQEGELLPRAQGQGEVFGFGRRVHGVQSRLGGDDDDGRVLQTAAHQQAAGGLDFTGGVGTLRGSGKPHLAVPDSPTGGTVFSEKVPGSPRTIFPDAGEFFLHRRKTEGTCALCAPGGTDCGAHRPVERPSGAAGQRRSFGLYGICPFHCQQLGENREAPCLPAPGKDCGRQV